jgi:hypothetical protein
MENTSPSMGQWLKGLPGRVADNVIATLIAAAILSAAFLGWVTGAFEAIVAGDASRQLGPSPWA